MRFETNASIIDTEKEEAFDVGDTVTIRFHDGGGKTIRVSSTRT